jgi:hypothetical protein
MKTVAAVLLLIALSAPLTAGADQVIWDYSLSELPPGWEIIEGEWVFQPDGAHSDASAGFFEHDWNELRSPELVLPEGTDYITITADQTSLAWASGASGTFAFARVVLQINGNGFIYWNNSSGADSLPIFIIPDDTAAGDTVRVDLLCVAISWPETAASTPLHRGQPQASADFHIWDFVLTAYGDISTLTPSTWGAIKTTFPR